MLSLVSEATKRCSKCQQTLPTTSFFKNKSRYDGLQGYCKECKCKRDRQYDAEHRDKVNGAARRRRSTGDSRQAHLDALTRYRAKHQSVRTKLQMARKSAKLKRTPAWLTEFDLLKMKCLYQLAAMRSRESGYDWHVDHIIPLQGANVCGLHVPGNLRVIPAIDNMRKSNQYEA
jgi:hypothetical protein